MKMQKMARNLFLEKKTQKKKYKIYHIYYLRIGILNTVVWFFVFQQLELYPHLLDEEHSPSK